MQSLTEENKETNPPVVENTGETTPPSVVHIDTGRNRTALWVLIAMVVGFILPVCACSFLFFTGLIGAAAFGFEETTTNTAFTESVALIAIDGTIVSGDENEFAIGSAISGVIISDLEAAENDPLIKAIVLRVDSPGGTVTGSAQIQEVIAKLEKPVVVSMESLAASGGYYVSAPADYIFARPDTWTGSIGVIVQFINAEGFLEENGIEMTTIASGENKAFGGLFRDLTAEQEAIMRTLVDESFNDFVQVIVDGRNLSEEEVLALADGRIYSGRQALENGLVDELGNLDDAITKAAQLGGISGEPQVVEFEHLPSPSQLLFGFSSKILQNDAARIKAEIDHFSTPKLEYRFIGSP